MPPCASPRNATGTHPGALSAGPCQLSRGLAQLEMSPGLRNQQLLVSPCPRSCHPLRPLRWPSGVRRWRGAGAESSPVLGSERGSACCWVCLPSLQLQGEQKMPGFACPGFAVGRGVQAARVKAVFTILGQEARERMRQRGKDVWRRGAFKKNTRSLLLFLLSQVNRESVRTWGLA